MKRRAPPPADDPVAAVRQIVADPDGIVWFGVKHYSPASALHVRRLIHERRPVAVLVEGPDDATDLIDWLVHPDTAPPVTILSSWVDRKNKLGRNGELSASPDIPARYRGWWPFVAFGPEYAALSAGREIGAHLQFIDASLKAQLPTMQQPERQPNHRELGESAYVQALARRSGFADFEQTWMARLEAGSATLTAEAFRQQVLTFAWCARNVGSGPVDEGTNLRERHMRWWVERVRKDHPSGEIVVVTGAYHAVALPFVTPKKAPGKPDRDTQTLLCAHSYPALARLTGQQPAWGEHVHQAAREGSERPHNTAALHLLVEASWRAREAGAPVGTADVVGAVTMAEELARLRRMAEVGPHEVIDAVTSAFVKGERGSAGDAVLAAAQAVLVGRRMGHVAEGAGRPPLIDDYLTQAKSFRLDLSGAEKVVRCDFHKDPRHRRKSAFLHACRILDVPMFAEVDDTDAPYKGPNLAEGADTHLTTETWAVRWREDVDDRLVEISDRGPTIAEAAADTLQEALERAGTDVQRVARTLLEVAQARATGMLGRTVERLRAAAAVDGALDHLVEALEDVLLLQSYQDALETVGDRALGETARDLFTRTCLRLPAAGRVADEEAPAMVARLQTLARVAVSTGLPTPPDRALLVDRLSEVAGDIDSQPLVRGASAGLLHALGALDEAAVSGALVGYLDGPVERVLRGGAFLEGVLRVQRSLFLASHRLLGVVTDVLVRLDDEAFARVLPDLRRAFAVFIPAELERIGAEVVVHLSGDDEPSAAPQVSAKEASVAVEIDARVRDLLADWLRS